MNQDLESLFINRYVIKNKRQRYLDFIGNPKRRGAFLEMLYHGQDLNFSLFQQLKGNYQQGVDAIFNKAGTVKGGDKCYIVSVGSVLDGKQIFTTEAIERLVCNEEGFLIIFGELEVVYYEGEPPHNQYLSL